MQRNNVRCALLVASASNFANANNNGNANYNTASNVNSNLVSVPIRTQTAESHRDSITLRDKESTPCCFEGNEFGSQMPLDTSNAASTGGVFEDTKLYEISTIKELNRAFYNNAKVSQWKYPTQLYEDKLLLNNFKLRDELRSKKYRESPKVHFGLNERGKHREIDSPLMKDRVPGKSLNQNVLLPAIRPKLIYDNYASLQSRGTSFARKRIWILLQKAQKEFGNDFYAGRLDVLGYFPHIDRPTLYKMLTDLINYPSTYDLIRRTIGSVSEVGLDLGSECPQSYAVYYLNDVDQWCKVVKGLKYYGRYMDDIFIFAKTREELEELIEEIRVYLKKRLKLDLNKKKTVISLIHRGFTFMQVNYWMGEDGKLKHSPCNARFIRERRKLKSYRRLYGTEKCKMTIRDIHNSYLSWRGSTLQLGNCRKRVEKMDKLYNELFSGLRDNVPVVERERKTYLYSEVI